MKQCQQAVARWPVGFPGECHARKLNPVMALLHGERVRPPQLVDVAVSRNVEDVDRRGGRGTRAPALRVDLRHSFSEVLMRYLIGYLTLLILACSSTPTAELPAVSVLLPGVRPITDMPIGTRYKGLPGGLYAGETNTPHPAHDLAGRVAAAKVVPRLKNGAPNSAGQFVFLTLGFSNAAQEGCAKVTVTAFPPCNAWSFIGQARADAQVRAKTLTFFPGAMAGQANDSWDQASDSDYDLVETRMAGAISPAQVAVIWFKIAHRGPTVALPANNADAYDLVISTGNAIRAMRARYPHLAQVYLSPRIYSGYNNDPLNPEPYAYESAFAVRWVIEAQIHQRLTGQVDPLAGNLGGSTFPWVGWGPYLWANGTVARQDGLTWKLTDFEKDRVHPSKAGETKFASRMATFFKNSPYSACWFRSNQSC